MCIPTHLVEMAYLGVAICLPVVFRGQHLDSEPRFDMGQNLTSRFNAHLHVTIEPLLIASERLAISYDANVPPSPNLETVKRILECPIKMSLRRLGMQVKHLTVQAKMLFQSIVCRIRPNLVGWVPHWARVFPNRVFGRRWQLRKVGHHRRSFYPLAGRCRR